MTAVAHRIPWPAALFGLLAVVLGAAGLIRGAVPQPLANGGGAGTGAGSVSPPIVVTAAFVVPPVPPAEVAAAYFTVYNTTAQPDTLQTVLTGAGASAVLHVSVNGQMTVPAGGVSVPAHGKVVFTEGGQHVMIESLFGPLTPGQSVDIELDFARAGPVSVTAPVIALGSPPPGGAATSAQPGGAATSAQPSSTGSNTGGTK